jgi:hypothetical protein
VRPESPRRRGAELLISARGARRESRLRDSARLGQPCREVARKYLKLAADQGNEDAAGYVDKYFSNKSVYVAGTFALIKGVGWSKEGDGVLVEFEATADGSAGPLQVTGCAAALRFCTKPRVSGVKGTALGGASTLPWKCPFRGRAASVEVPLPWKCLSRGSASQLPRFRGASILHQAPRSTCLPVPVRAESEPLQEGPRASPHPPRPPGAHASPLPPAQRPSAPRQVVRQLTDCPARQPALDSRLIVYRPGDYAGQVTVTADGGRSALTQDDDSRRAGTLGFALPDGLAQGPVRLEFEFGSWSYSCVGLGLLE